MNILKITLVLIATALALTRDEIAVAVYWAGVALYWVINTITGWRKDDKSDDNADV